MWFTIIILFLAIAWVVGIVVYIKKDSKGEEERAVERDVESEIDSAKVYHDNINNQREPIPIEQSRSTVETEQLSSQGIAIDTLRIIAYLLLFFSIIGAVVIWATMSTIKVGYSEETNPLGIFLGFATLISGIGTWSFFIVICDMAMNLLFFRKNYNANKGEIGTQ